jgi:HEAT repeat protein
MVGRGLVNRIFRPKRVLVDLIESLQNFDGKSTSELERLSASLPRNDDSVAQLLAVAEHDDTTIQVGSTWILKRWLEEGLPQVETSAPHLVRLLNHATHWEVRLHLLQMLTSLRVPARSLSRLKRLLTGLLTDDNKFVRAWSLSVLAAIADQSEAMRQDVISTIEEAGNDEAASVRARVRQIQKRYKWTTQTGRTKR